MSSKAALFSDAAQAAAYAAHRPSYPAALFEAILAHVPGRSLAVDIATGSGQAAVALAASFDSVIAQDGSQAQLDHADRGSAPNVAYQLADAHDTALPAGCADLVTVAQALHWCARVAVRGPLVVRQPAAACCRRPLMGARRRGNSEQEGKGKNLKCPRASRPRLCMRAGLMRHDSMARRAAY